MKSKIFCMSVIALIGLQSEVLAQTGGVPSTAPQAQPAVAKASPQVAGTVNVFVEPNGPAEIAVDGPNARKVKNGDPIFIGDVLKTAELQTAQVILSDKSELWITPKSEFVVQTVTGIANQKQTITDLRTGSVRALIEKTVPEKKHFFMRTQAATMGVRGTEFMVENELGGKTSLYTLDGSVAMGKTFASLNDEKSSRIVKAGMKSDCGVAQRLPRAPVKYSRAEITRIAARSPFVARAVKEKHEKRVKPNKMKERHEKTSRQWKPVRPRRRLKRRQK